MGEIRFDEVAARYLKRQAAYGRDIRTIGYQVEILRRYFGGRLLTEITPPEIERMIAARIEAGVAPATANRQRANLSGIFSFAIFEGLLPGPNPVRRVRKFRETQGRTRFLSREEARRLVAVAPAHIKLVILFGIYTGGRLRELLSLRWADVEIFPSPLRAENGRLIHGMVHFRAETTKGGKYRAVPICEELAHAIRCHPRRGGLDLVFTWRGHPLRSIRTAFENAREEAGLGRDVVIHTLRHTFCSNYVMDGGDIYALRDLAGHSTVAVTQRYAHLSAAHILKSGAFIGAPKGTDTGD